MRIDETWYRLLEWTGRQTPSERLAAIILRTEGYKNLDPSHPLGGKDGGKDAIANKDGKTWIMAVYFPRGQQTLTAIKAKFTEDFQGIQKNGADGIAFVTNQELTLSERDEIKTLANGALCEIYHLERVTTILDSPEMHQVRKQFLDIDYPGVSGINEDWQILEEHSKNLVERVQDRIGNKIHLARLHEVKKIEISFRSAPFTAVLGMSGIGKTALCKNILNSRDDSYHRVWLKAKSLNEQDFNGIGIKIGLSGTFQNLLKNPLKPGIFVIDGLEKLNTDTEFANLGALLSVLAQQTSTWQVILTCQPESFERIQYGLSSVNISTEEWQKIEIDSPREELDAVWKEFPNLKPLKTQRELSSLFTNLKILDLLASKSLVPHALDPAQSWVGESDIIDWFWEAFVISPTDGMKRSRFMQVLAEKLADTMDDELPEIELDGADLDPVEGLLVDKLCSRNGSNVAFGHDLYGDWARQKILISKKSSIKPFIETKIHYPQWHRAIRLYGLHLLEKNSTLDAWKLAVKSFESEDGKASLPQDLLLDALLFSAQPLAILERVWPVLIEDDGKYLHRFLKRFQFVATSPNPAIISVAKEIGISSPGMAATIQRVPFGPQWIPVLMFLQAHKEEVVKNALGITADICFMWLSLAPVGFPGRSDAAELAVMCAEEVLAIKTAVQISIFDDNVDEIAFKGALFAISEQRDRVRNIARFASRRDSASGPLAAAILKSVEEAERVRSSKENNKSRRPFIPISPLGGSRGVKQKPWELGPSERVISAFQKVCLEQNGLDPIIDAEPELARELLLALLIDEPSERDEYDSFSISRDQLCTENVNSWFPVSFFRGPFLSFLRKNPLVAIDGILDITNFCTDRWIEQLEKGNPYKKGFSFKIDGKSVTWYGDSFVFHWYRYSAQAPIAAACALMALEKFLYEKIEAKENIDEYLDLLILRSKSVSVGGVFSALSKYKPDLLLRKLQGLIETPEFLLWDFLHTFQGNSHLINFFDPRRNNSFLTKLSSDFFSQEHLKQNLETVAQTLFVNNESFRFDVEPFCLSWTSRMSPDNEEGLESHLETLLVKFTWDNYKWVQDEKYGRLLQLTPPDDFVKKGAALVKAANEQQSLLIFPTGCKSILDGKKTVFPDQLENFWNYAQSIAQLVPSPDSEPGLVAVEDSICGAASVLICLHREWLSKFPDREKWCFDQVLTILNNPPPRMDIEVEEDIRDYKWYHFSARIAAAIWSENVNDEKWRKAVAISCTSFHYKTVEVLFKECFSRRRMLGAEWLRLQHLLFRWAEKRFVISIMRNNPEAYGETKQGFAKKIALWREEEISAFTSKEIDPKLDSLSSFSFAKDYFDTLEDKHLSRRAERWPKVDLELISYALHCIPDINQAHDESERFEWIQLWKGCLDLTIDLLNKGNVEGKLSNTISQWDNWVFEKVARVIVNLRENESSEVFWKPILSLGPLYHYWIQTFFRELFFNGVTADKVPKTFIAEWKLIFEFCFTSPHWAYEKKKYGGDLEDLWNTMACLPNMISKLWSENNLSAVESLKPQYRLWLEHNFSRSKCASSVVEFLTMHPKLSIAFEVLVLIDQVYLSRDDYNWKRNEFGDIIAAFIEQLFIVRFAELKSNAAAMGSFQRILKRLAEVQNPIALDLLTKMS